MLGDLNQPISYTIKHFLARAGCLILLPALTYTLFFYIHLKYVGCRTTVKSSATKYQLRVLRFVYPPPPDPRIYRHFLKQFTNVYIFHKPFHVL